VSIEAMKQALEALEKSEPVNQGVGYVKHHNNAKRALRAAIAEAEKAEDARLEQIMLDVWQDVGDPKFPSINITKLAGHRTVTPWVVKLVQDAVAAEREACAKVCEDWPIDREYVYSMGVAIRARGKE